MVLLIHAAHIYGIILYCTLSKSSWGKDRTEFTQLYDTPLRLTASGTAPAESVGGSEYIYIYHGPSYVVLM